MKVFVVTRGDKVLIRKRERKGLLAGVYEFPNDVSDVSSKLWLGQMLGDKAATYLGKGKHVFSHLEWDMAWYEIKTDSLANVEGYIWANISELKATYMLPSAFTKFCKNHAILGF